MTIALPANEGTYKYILIKWTDGYHIAFGDPISQTHYSIALDYAIKHLHIYEKQNPIQIMQNLRNGTDYISGGGLVNIEQDSCRFHDKSKQYGPPEKSELLSALQENGIEKQVRKIIIE